MYAKCPCAHPPKRKSSKRLREGFDKLAQDTAELERLREQANESVFYDKDGIAVRTRRELARADFEYFVEVTEGLTNATDVWNSATIIQRSKVFFGGLVKMTKGRIGDMPRVDFLWHKRDALYWWAIRLIPDFTTIFGKWHSETTSHIHLVANTSRLETSHRAKNDLTILELGLMIQQLCNLDKSVEYWKQHYLAWLLPSITAAHPGSSTLCLVYEKTLSSHQTCTENKMKHCIGLTLT